MKKGLLILPVLAFLAVSCGDFYTLKSSNAKNIGPIKGRAPYTSVEKYYGFIDPAATPDGNYKGKKAYYLYFWVPAAIDEVGVAMYSPVTDKPGKSDFVGPKYEANYAKDSKSFFDTYVVLERMAVIDPTKIKDAASAPCQLLDENDDTSEIDANPAGQQYNSVLRVKTSTDNPTKALVRSVYRITFTSFRGDVKGSFLAQVGTNIPGVKVASSLAELHKLVNEAK